MTETYPQQVQRHRVFGRTESQLQSWLPKLDWHSARRATVQAFQKKLTDPAFAQQVEIERRSQMVWVVWILVFCLTPPFDTLFTFGQIAAFLRDSFGLSLPLTPVYQQQAIAITLALTVLIVTICIRFATESHDDRERLNKIAANASEVPELVKSMSRKARLRLAWATILAILLASAVIAEILTIAIYNKFSDRDSVSDAVSPLSCLALATPYTITFVLHSLLLFLPWPSSGLTLGYPCSPRSIEKELRKANKGVEQAARGIYLVFISVSDQIVHSQLAGLLTYRQVRELNESMGRTVLLIASASGSATAVVNTTEPAVTT